MIMPVIIVACIAAGLFCWLLFELATLALPVIMGITAASWAYQRDAGAIGAVVLGTAAALLVFGAGHVLILTTRSLWARTIVVGAFVMPAMVCGYCVIFGIVRYLVPSSIWQASFAAIGAVAVGIAAFKQVTKVPAPVQTAGSPSRPGPAPRRASVAPEARRFRPGAIATRGCEARERWRPAIFPSRNEGQAVP
ncbi:hypothetical protein [Xanthobacter sp. YC-JY1]|uniref:hypothetical protein n=1 Tax=Xanthobacter TaxID=279 RepID=UPI001F3FEA8E|nr:hypothetical protein [Xanthobacter sp. YC-JY1]UJX44234.1 hypothetical protein D7006_05465 [Xanthobacter sp. YC-JY1]